MTPKTDGKHRQVIAKQDDTVDLICYRYFCTTKDITEQVLALNPDHKNTLIFAGGEVLLLPVADIASISKTETTINLWN